MSVALRKTANKKHNIFDDMEAVFWVLLLVAFHHFGHSGYFWPKIFNFSELNTYLEVPNMH